MSIVMSTPDARDLVNLAEVLDGWQEDGGPLQLHPGDLGWHSLRGASATAAALRVWPTFGASPGETSRDSALV